MGKWINLESIMLSDAIQIQEDKKGLSHMQILAYNLQIMYKQVFICEQHFKNKKRYKRSKNM